MTRKCVWLIAAVLALIPLTFARGETARNLIRKYGSEAQYNLSAIPELLKLNANVFFVDNEATNALDAADGRHGQTPDQPFATYDYAISQCTAGQDNVIVILPYSTEDYDSAGDCDVDVSGITTIGLGVGPARPKFLFTNAAGTFVVGSAGDGATFMNLTWQASVTGVTVGVQIEDNADHVSFIDCEWLDGELSGTDEFVTAVDVVLEVNDLTFENCRWTSLVAGATAAIDIGDGAAGGLTLRNCTIYGDYAVAGIFSDQALTRVLVERCNFYNANADEFGIEAQGTSNVGVIRDCTFITSGNYVDAGGLGLMGNVFKTSGDSDTDSVSYTLADDGVTAAKVAANAIGASELAADAVTEIWNNNLSAFAGAGYAGTYLKTVYDDWLNGGRLDLLLDAVKVVTDDLAGISQIGDKIVADMDANSTPLAILTDLGGISQVGDKVQADMDANSVLYWQPRVSSVSADEVTQDLFAVAGGPIQILEFYGTVDVAIGANATTCKIISDATAGAAFDNEFTTAVAITDDAAGTLYVFTAANPSVLTPLTGGGSAGATNFQVNWYCPVGAIEQTMSADPGGAAGDHITWYMVWRPLAAGVTVTPQ